jgi:transcriptional regulator with XRE-family HTH domain
MSGFGDELVRWMTARQVSVRALAEVTGYSAGHISDLRSGRRLPSAETADDLDDALEAGGKLAIAAQQAPAIPDGDKIRRGLDAALSTGMMSDRSLDDWDATVHRYGRATRDRPAGILLADLYADLAELKTTMERHRSASALRRLTLVTAQMSGMVCLTLIKLGDRAAFRAWARTARQAALEAGDPVTVAWAEAQEAYGHYYSGDHAEAVQVARHARRQHPACTGAALAAALEMRALAVLGDARQASDALAAAETALAALRPDEQESSALAYTESQLRFHEGNAWTHLRDTRAGVAAQDQALALCHPRDYTDWAMIRLDRALCMLYDGDASGAVVYADQPLQTLTPDRRAGIIAMRGHDLLGAPSARRSSVNLSP